ncbi:MAG: ScyD/ScyE family protein [Ardenticatenaceae bacterium]|nr:ScyD/ScyE family protein [Ardenticatenaceae bacterium]
MPKRVALFVVLIALALSALAGCARLTAIFSRPPSVVAEPQVRVVVDGLLNPMGMAALPGGGLLVAEEGTGQDDKSAGISLITVDGQAGRFISGLPSSMDSGDLAGVPLVALSPAGDKVYLANFGEGHLWTLPLTPEQQRHGLALTDRPLTQDPLTPEMMPLNNVRLTNPFDITFDTSGVPVVTDASGNGVAKETADGRTRFIHRFAPLANPMTATEKDTIEPVPTGITRVGDEYYVTLTGGCPYPQGGGQLVAIDEQRNQRTLVTGLNMPIDVAQAPDGTIWVLEFARFTPNASCFTGSGYQARSGRLSRLQPDGTLRSVITDLNFPGAVLPMPDGSLYISEVFTGRILRVTFGQSPDRAPGIGPASDGAQRERAASSPSTAIAPDEYDRVLSRVVQAQGLHPNPGAELREGDTPLARLGQELFFDPILSGDRNISCATCHHPALAMADGRVLPIGTGGVGLGPQRTFDDQITLGPEASFPRRLAGAISPQTGQTIAHNPFEGTFVARNSLTVLNSALFPTQFWDSRVEQYALGTVVKTREQAVNDLGLTDALAVQALFPVTGRNEMAGATFDGLAPQAIRRALIERLRAIPAYVAGFQEVFGPGDGSPQNSITEVRLVEALAAFERRFIFTDAPWDRYLAGQRDALSTQQKRGALLFFGQLDPAVNCAQCHSGDLFSDFQHHNLLVPQLGPGKGNGYTRREDWGRAGVTFDLRDRYAFRTPSLRNVELTAPYFHDGAFATLAGAIRHHADIWGSAQRYDPSANAIPPALYSSLQPFQPEKQWATAAPELRDGLPLSEDDIADLVAFLTGLTDPAARDLRAFIPDRVPSGLPLDPVPGASEPAEDAPGPPPEIGGPEPGSPDTAPAELRFRDVAAAVGLNFRQGAFRTAVFQDPVAAMGGGLCWIDYNNDGWLDLYVVNSHAEDEEAFWRRHGGLPRNALFRNDHGRFTDVTAASGTDLAMRGNGCVAADFNGDGRWDLYVTADGPNALLWNNGDGTFTEGAAVAGVAAPEWNSAAVVGDVNGDGLPDLFVAAYIDLNHKIPKPSGAFPQDYYGLPDRLYLNNGAPPGSPAGRVTFREVTEAAGLLREERGLGALLGDLDRDGDLDLYIANDGQPNRLYANEPWPGGVQADPERLGFRFVDLTNTANVGDSGSGMGVAGGDYDGDGLIDLFITNWERELNALYRNETAEEGHLTFQYSTFRIGISGLGNGLTGWGTALVDVDQDTDEDLLIVNGRVPVTNLASDPELVRLYRNRSWNLDGSQGPAGQFREWTEQVGLKAVGPLLGRGSAVADYDNDGDPDVAINTIAGNLVLLQNDGRHGNWLQVKFDGFFPGAFATLELPDGRQLVRDLYTGSSYLASEDPRLHFGLGSASVVPHLLVVFPNGQRLEFNNVRANQMLRVPSPSK